jgi:membrane protein DedA with SNARE-associated domain
VREWDYGKFLLYSSVGATAWVSICVSAVKLFSSAVGRSFKQHFELVIRRDRGRVGDPGCGGKS